ncbi:MAG TPA: FtsX-like permease family protein [Edaphocola sp.]|nr:FtsX-like permease family protein [Edaphocola sp.]
MNLPFKISLRYLKGKNSTQAINIVSRISIGAVALSTAAMIILFSIYNGLESYVKGMYTAFYPEIKVSVKTGKFFNIPEEQIQRLKSIPGVKGIALSIEDMALLEGRDHQKVIRLKGVDNQWFQVNEMEKFVNTGPASWPSQYQEVPSNIGVGIVSEMGIEPANPFQKIQLYYPRGDASISGLDIATALSGLTVAPYASFHVQPELDGNYFLIPLKDAQAFMNVENQISALEISLNNPNDLKKVQNKVKKILGSQYEIISRIEQNRSLFMATQMEKWMIYGILFLVLVIASFNMVGVLAMLAVEKKIDVSILKSMGMKSKTIRNIFLNLGLLIAVVGGIIGLLIGLLFVFTQIQWGWLKMGEGFLDAYPVELQAFDILVVCVTVLFVGLAAAIFPANKASKQKFIFRDE